jgi:putative ABC transport system permease protein
MQFVRRVLYLLRFRRHDDDLSAEVASHRALAEEDLARSGLAPEDAKAAAGRALGNDAVNRNRARDIWISPWLQDLGQDVRFAARVLLKDRRFTLAAIIALALGIGANTTAFTFVNGIVLRPLSLANPDRLVSLRMVDARDRRLGVSYADARDWRDAARSFSALVVSFDFTTNVSDEGIPAGRYMGSFIAADAFQMVGRQALLGRTFTPDDDRLEAPRVAVIAHSVWTTRYANDPSIIGRTIRINDVPTTVIGVMPERFHFPISTEIWLPGALTMGPPATLDQRRGVRNVLGQALARLADGVSIEQAQAEMDGITSRLARDFPDTNAGVSVKVLSLDAAYREGFAQMLLLAMGAVAFVLLIACVNVANLLLARASDRSREIAIRASLGGTRWRVVRQLLIESLLIAAAAGALGLAVARYCVHLFASALREGIEGPQPFWFDWSMDIGVYLFLVGLCVATAALFGLLPALHISKTNAIDTLKDGGRGATSGMRARRWTNALMVAEFALTLVLLSGAGLMLRSFIAVYNAGEVLDTSNVVTMRLSLGGTVYAPPERIKQFFQQLDARLAAIPAMGMVTVASDIPIMTLTNSQRQLAIRGQMLAAGDTPPTVAYLYIGPRYFQTMRLPLLRGREFTEQDGAPGQDSAIVNERFASMFFPDADPIGQRIQLTNAAAPQAPKPWLTIVGIAQTVPQNVADKSPEPVVYVTVRGEPAPHRLVSVIARTTTDPAAAIGIMREEVRRIDPAVAGYFTRTMDQVKASARWPTRVFGSIFGLLAGVALVISSVGLYALTAHGVTQRTAEIGVRMALGARSAQVLWLFVRRTMVQLTIGLAVGLAGAIMAGRQLERFLVRTPSTDPVALGLVATLLVVVATLASLWSARRAARVDPVVALRHG